MPPAFNSSGVRSEIIFLSFSFNLKPLATSSTSSRLCLPSRWRYSTTPAPVKNLRRFGDKYWVVNLATPYDLPFVCFFVLQPSGKNGKVSVNCETYLEPSATPRDSLDRNTVFFMSIPWAARSSATFLWDLFSFSLGARIDSSVSPICSFISSVFS